MSDNKISIRITAEDEYSKVLAAAGQAGQKLAKDFATLNIKSALDIQTEKARMVAAFEAIKKSGVASADEIKRAHKAMQDRLDDIDSSTQKMSTGLSGVAQMFAGAFAADRVVAFAKASFEASLAVDSISSKLKIMAGSDQGAAKEWQFIRAEAKRLGLDLLSTAESYSTFAVAAKGSSIEGEESQRIFSAMSEAVTALHLPAEKASAVMYQFQQMISKGKVNMEDLKTASESFPGLMGMMAQSLGITTAELMKQMQAGTLMAADVLPKLAEQLHLTYGKAAEEAAGKGRAAINKFNAEVFETKKSFGELVSWYVEKSGPAAEDMARAPRNILSYLQLASAGWLAILDRGKEVLKGILSGELFTDKGYEAVSARIDKVDNALEEYYNDLAKQYGVFSESTFETDLQRQEKRKVLDQRRRNEAKKTGDDLVKIELDYAKMVGDTEAQLSAELNKQYEERKKAVTDAYNQKKAYALDNGEESKIEKEKKAVLLGIEKQHARDVEIVKAQMQAKNLINLQNEVDMETLLIKEKVAKKVITEQQGEQQITALTVASARMQYEAKKAVTEKIAEIYGRSGEEYKTALKDQESAHKNYLSANLSAYQKYSDQIKKLDQEIKDFRMSIQERIRDAKQKDMTDSQKYADDQLRIDEALARSKKALAAGKTEEALKENELALSLASRLLDKKVESDSKEIALEKERVAKIKEINDQAAQGSQSDQQKRLSDIAKVNAEYAQKQADAAKEKKTTQEAVLNTETAYNKILENREAINRAQSQEAKAGRDELQKIANMKIDDKAFAVKVDGPSLDAVKSVISDLTKTETKTIIVRTVGSSGEPSFSNIGGKAPGFFEGGKVLGGSPLRDSVSAVLAKHEWVINNKATGFWGDNMMAAINAPMSASGVRLQNTLRGMGGQQSESTAAPVHLHLPGVGESFKMHAQPDVLGQLSTAIRRLKMTRPQ